MRFVLSLIDDSENLDTNESGEKKKNHSFLYKSSLIGVDESVAAVRAHHMLVPWGNSYESMDVCVVSSD